MNLNSTQQFQEALQVVISRLNADLREASGKLEHLPACEWQSQHGRALLNREQDLHTAWCVLNGMRSTQAEPVAVASPTMEQKIAGAHAADIKPSQAEAVYLAMLATAPAAAAPAAVAVPDGGTPGLWSVRKREVDGELRDCFVTAPDCQGLPYDAEIMGDDEYRDDNGIARKLADCELIVTAVNAYRAALAATPAADAQDQEAIAREQEACALACEALVANATDWDSSYWDQACNRCALEVRNRKAQQNPQTKDST